MADRFKIALGKASLIVPVNDVKTAKIKGLKSKITISDRLGRVFQVELMSVNLSVMAIPGGTMTTIEMKIFWAGAKTPDTLTACLTEVLKVTMPNGTVYDVRIQDIRIEPGTINLKAGTQITYTGQVENMSKTAGSSLTTTTWGLPTNRDLRQTYSDGEDFLNGRLPTR